jgi:hypothetical protein
MGSTKLSMSAPGFAWGLGAKRSSNVSFTGTADFFQRINRVLEPARPRELNVRCNASSAATVEEAHGDAMTAVKETWTPMEPSCIISNGRAFMEEHRCASLNLSSPRLR